MSTDVMNSNKQVAGQGGQQDERLREESSLKRHLNRPELGAFSGAVLVFIFFILTAGDTGMFGLEGSVSWLEFSAQLGILAIGACLLMIAGEFDLSIGSMIGFAGMLIAIPAVHWGWPIEMAILFAFIGAMSIGALNGYIVVRTGLPSFIVSLAFLFILRGLTIGLSALITNRTIVGGVSDIAEGSFVAWLFSGHILTGIFQYFATNGWIESYADGTPVVPGIPMLVVWWFVLGAVASWVLIRTQIGNWIFAAGGDENAAKNTGIPVARLKICLFAFTAFCATLFAAIQVMEYGSASADRGLLKEFEAIIAAVIGGALLTGGYGSVVGACVGALIFGVVSVGLNFMGVDSSWFRVFLGIMLLVAVVFNNFIRKRVLEAR